MNKPYLIYNGTSYIALCTMSDYNETVCPIATHDIIFIDECIHDTLLDISCDWDVNKFNVVIEEKFGLVMDVKIDEFTTTPLDDYVSIETHTNNDELVEVDTAPYSELLPYVIEYDTHYQFNINEYLYDIDTNPLFRLFLIINVPAIVLYRDQIVYDAFSTYLHDDDLSLLDYSLGEFDVSITLTAWIIVTPSSTNDMTGIRDFSKFLDRYNKTAHTPITYSLSEVIPPYHGSFGTCELELVITITKEKLKKQLFSFFIQLKDFVRGDAVEVEITA